MKSISWPLKGTPVLKRRKSLSLERHFFILIFILFQTILILSLIGLVTEMQDTLTIGSVMHVACEDISDPTVEMWCQQQMGDQVRKIPNKLGTGEVSRNKDCVGRVLFPAEAGVQGRLKRSVKFWTQELHASEFVLNVIKDGYKILMVSFPERYYEHNNRSSLKYKSFVESAIEELLYKNLVKRMENRPLCCNPL